jgi:hypothetical protein
VPWLAGALVLAGAAALVRRPSPEGVRGLAAVLLVWSLVTTAVVAVWLPLDWERYHLPVIAVASVLAGCVRTWSRHERDGATG